MAIETISINHSTTQDLYISESGAKSGTREKFNKASVVAQAQSIEPFRFRNAFAVDQMGPDGRAVTGGLFKGYQNLVVQGNGPSNLYGSYRTAVKRKMHTAQDTQTYRGLGDVTFNPAFNDEIIFPIDNYQTTNKTIIASIDGQATSWAQLDVQNTVEQTLLNDITTKINYSTYQMFLPALGSKVNENGQSFKGGDKSYLDGARIVDVSQFDSDAEYTNAIFEAFSSLGALPDDPYVYGFYENQLIMIISFLAKQRILKDKLVIFDGSNLGINGGANTPNESVFYLNLPYLGMIGGVLYFTSNFLRAPGEPITNAPEYIITPVYKFAPLLFDIPKKGLNAYAEIAPGTNYSLMLYASALWGAKIEPLFAHYLRIGVRLNGTIPEARPVEYDDVDWQGVTIKYDKTAGGFIVEGFGYLPDETAQIIYQLTEVSEPVSTSNGDWTSLVYEVGGPGTDGSTLTAFQSEAITQTANGDVLDSTKDYRITIAASADGTYNGIIEGETIKKYTYKFSFNKLVWAKESDSTTRNAKRNAAKAQKKAKNKAKINNEALNKQIKQAAKTVGK